MASLRLVPIFSAADGPLLGRLATDLADLLHLAVEQHPPSFDPELAFDSSRGQYNSRILLAQLLREDERATRVLGVSSVDLFLPVLTYVFGEAQLDGRAAVVSSYRLDNTLYGLPENRELLYQRLLKESVHELGHTFGLVHCHVAGCVMNASTYAEDIDLKGERYCGGCGEAVRSYRGAAAAGRG